MNTLVMISFLMNLNPGNMPPGATGATSMLPMGEYVNFEACVAAATDAKIVRQDQGPPLHIVFVCLPKADSK
jgi:hypothetical protein